MAALSGVGSVEGTVTVVDVAVVAGAVVGGGDDGTADSPPAVAAVLAASILHDGETTVAALKRKLAALGAEVRL